MKRQMTLGSLAIVLWVAVSAWQACLPGAAQAASLVVTTTADENDGTVMAGGCSLREAIDSANRDQNRGGCVAADLPYGNDSIAVPAGTFDLSTIGDQLNIDDGSVSNGRDLSIVGAGAPQTIIQGAATYGTASSRVLLISAGSVRLEGLTLRHGRQGAGGGGVRFGSGSGAQLTIVDCEIRDNQVTGTSHGAGLYLAGAGGSVVTISGSSITGNEAGGSAGGIYDSGGTNSLLSISNSTIYGNKAKSNGGAIRSVGTSSSVIELNNVTITANHADNDSNERGGGGGIYYSSGSAIYLSNTILAGNLDGSALTQHPDCSTSNAATIVSRGYNLIGIGDLGGCTGFANGVNGDLVGSAASPLDPLLQNTLSTNGGPTSNLLPYPNSLAVNAGNPSAADGALADGLRHCSERDQRGQARPLAERCDIGAIEGTAPTICGDGILQGEEDCEAPFGECCNEDTCAFIAAGTTCRVGSGDLCDADETCTGSSADCPVDLVQPRGTVCNPGSGDGCDPDEVCSGVAGVACPTDTVTAAGTVCNPGSGDACDPDEECTGTADQPCPTDSYAPSSTICNAGSGDACDPDELCPGGPDQPCPNDTISAAGTVCRTSSGDSCDPAEVCSGAADAPCPAQSYAAAGTACVVDANLCTTDMCNGSGSCVATNNQIACDDGDKCTGNDACSEGRCVGGAAPDCDDHDLCTTDTCSPAIGCINAGVPRGDACFLAYRSSFALKDDADDSKDNLKFAWVKGEAMTLDDLGTPKTTTDYALCIYDGQNGTPSYAGSLRLPARTPGWTGKSASIKYKDKTSSYDGIRAVQVKAGAAAGKSSVTFVAHGVPLDLPPPVGGGLFLHADPLIVELRNSDGTCWTSRFTPEGVKKNITSQFKAKGN